MKVYGQYRGVKYDAIQSAAPTKQPDTHEGSRYKYLMGCRCKECVEANREYLRLYMSGKRSKEKAARADAFHKSA